ncbi:CDP-diacylglycerol---serine O-phosphatidyltransferase [Formivibrio citricus]|uniref:CDP-diacylglycerol--serine O-phosphatidyltransferase n=1 Tax=Formivibrio citricus TaxID=83765 RepID=A0A1I4VPH9_9NEIS|nr:CDP-diacylglycerol--serine O-phosphatidyltransferase [Formivibrio citricus]SFN03158.1 CDP-diacylglycerol---serine O-phosphatidyltransferase [Formivibrio citricus]
MQPNRPLNLRRQSIYLLPNLFTLANLFAGFFAVVQAMNGHFVNAAMAIFAAMILDGLDGRVARMTHTQSAFGVEFDSLSDMVSFGVAPSLVAYEWALKGFGKVGWIVAFIYCAGAALRLARFNTNVGSVDKRWFQGLPSPAAAALVAGLVWVFNEYTKAPEPIPQILNWAALAATLFAGLTMVSNVRFWSFKEFHMRRTVPFLALLLIVFAISLLAFEPGIVLFGFFVCYALSGYVYLLYCLVRHQKPAVPSQN